MLFTFYEKECKVRTKSLIMAINNMIQMNRTQNLNSSLSFRWINQNKINKLLLSVMLLII